MWPTEGTVAARKDGAGRKSRAVPHPPQSCLACAARPRAACGGLDPAALAALSRLGRRHRLARGQALAWEGDDSLFCGNLISGMLKVGAATPGGKEQIVGLLYPSDFVGRLYEDQTPFTVCALTDVEICLFPRRALEAFLAEHPAMERMILRNILSALDDARLRMLTLARRSAEEKIAGFLLEMESRFGSGLGGDCGFDLPLTRGQIADILGLTIETVSRQLTRFKREGIIGLKGARTIAILDGGALEMRAEAA